MPVFTEPLYAIAYTERTNLFNMNLDLTRSDGSGIQGWLWRRAPIENSLLLCFNTYRCKEEHVARIPGHVYRYSDLIAWGNGELSSSALATLEVDKGEYTFPKPPPVESGYTAGELAE